MPEARPSSHRAFLHRAVALGLAFLGVWSLAWALVIAWIGYAPTPIYDHWDWLTPDQLQGRLFAFHNEHRIILTRVSLWIDLWLFRGQGIFPTALVLLFAAATVAAIDRLAGWTWPEARTPTRLAWIGVATCCVMSGFQFENFASGFQNSFTGVSFFAVASLAATARSAVCVSASRRRWWAIAAGGLMAGGAACMASGLLLLALVPLAALLAGRRWTAIGLACVAFVVWLYYMQGFPESEGGLWSRLAADPIGVVADGLAYLGGPIPNSLALWPPLQPHRLPLAWSFGAVAATASLVVLWRCRRRLSPAAPYWAAWGGVVLFVLGSGAATALGRGELGEFAMLANRYGAASGLLWAVLGVWWIASLRRWGQLRYGAVLLASAGLAAAQVFWVGGAEDFKHRKQDAAAALLSGVNIPSAYLRVYPDPAQPFRVGAQARKRRIAMFAAPWSRLKGETLDWAGAAVCERASVETNESVAGSPASLVRLGVVGALPNATKAVAVVTTQGLVTGLLIRGVSEDRASELFGGEDPPRWYGYADASSAATTYVQLVAVNALGRPICRVPEAPVLDARAQTLPP